MTVLQMATVKKGALAVALLLSYLSIAVSQQCTSDIFTCADGSIVVRVPPECEFQNCPGQACADDVIECPDGTTVGRIPPECDFAACPPQICGLDVFTCPNGVELIRDPALDCEFPPCPQDGDAGVCTLDVFTCPDGTTVSRDPLNDCEFFPCPEPGFCTQDVFTCPDGTTVSRDPLNDCEFFPCPDAGVCTLDVFTCPDGTTVSRDPLNDCEFFPCPDAGVCTQDVFTCPDGTTVSRDPLNDCEFFPCPDAGVCTLDVFTCPDGTTVNRDPLNDCEFFPCPDAGVCTLDVFTCPDGTTVSRDPTEDCQFFPCPDAGVCTQDVLNCPDGSAVGRDPLNDCNFFPCPEVPGFCTQDVFTCPDGTTVGRDSANNCLFFPCPEPEVCNEDVFTCPDGTAVGRDPANNCEFFPCPGKDVCTLDVFTCPDGTTVVRDPASDCQFFPCPSSPTSPPRNGEYFMLQASEGCIGRRRPRTVGRDQQLFFLECDMANDNVMWRLDDQGRFHSKVEDTECIQAGTVPAVLGDVDVTLRQGSKLYASQCDDSDVLPFQAFDEFWAIGMSDPLSLQNRPDLCVVYDGADPVIGESGIKLLSCSILGGVRAKGWTAVYPAAPANYYFTLSAAAGGCLARKAKGSGGDELYLKSCSSGDERIQWRLDDSGRVRSKTNDDECMQAAQYPDILDGAESLAFGTPMFVKHCGGQNKADFQIMAVPSLFGTAGSSVTSPLKLASRPDLCIIHFAADPTIGESRIMLVECANLGGGRKLGWTAEDPCMHVPFCEDF